MTQFRDGFMMKSPLPAHGKEFRDEAMKLSKQSSGRDDAPDYDNPEVVELLKKEKEANASHNDSAAKMTQVQPIDASAYFVAPDQMDYSDMIAAAGKMGAQKSKRAKELDDLEASGMTRGEARKKRRKNRKEGRKN